MNHLYIEPFSGMAGDMFLAALIDLGDPRFGLHDLRTLADMLVPGECRIEIENVWRGNLSGRMLSVHTPESDKAPHRAYADIEKIVRASRLARSTQDRALAVFWRIALAEGKVHGCAAEEIHFHEVGAVDTIVDVCGACFALERLGIERVWSSPPVTGTGTVRCAHGEMPVPAPAVSELLRGREISISGGGGERLTPTGAALLAEFCPTFESPGAFTPEAIGYGAGHRDPKVGPPNILRVQIGRARTSSSRGTAAGTIVWQVDVNLDDMTGEELATAAEALRSAGALDVWMSNVVMKKGRPGVVLSALCRAEVGQDDARRALEAVLFEHTSTLGMRWSQRERTECGRKIVDIVLEGAAVRVKVRERPNTARPAPPSARDLSPEHDDLAALAQVTSISIRELERRAIDAALEILRAQAKTATSR
jgi:pyridinium-3,5-bisthiocarboxylic acid mononucleotide nickel chelatase